MSHRFVPARARCATAVALLMMVGAGCSSDATTATTTITTTPATTATPSTTTVTTVTTGTTVTAPDAAAPTTFTAEVWADNWFSLYVNGELVGEDSVPITTERSFNAETISFTATYPLTIGLVSKDYRESDSGLEYIGTDRQQMGDGGVIAQITDTTTGAVIAATSSAWRGLVIHTAPTNTECVTSAEPDTDCESIVVDEPAGWAAPGFDDSSWTQATVYTEDEVGVKEGYTEISWDPSAELIWSASLKQDNTILWRTTVTG
mgnify:CR=1 FL=1